MDAFDADVLIYAAVPDHPLGERVLALLLLANGPPTAGTEHEVGEGLAAPESVSGVGSVLLLPELLSKPLRDRADAAVETLLVLLSRLDLRPLDAATAHLATTLGARYGLRAADAAHLATAVSAGADRFVTNNSKDFPQSIEEILITYPTDLPPAPGPDG